MNLKSAIVAVLAAYAFALPAWADQHSVETNPYLATDLAGRSTMP